MKNSTDLDHLMIKLDPHVRCKVSKARLVPDAKLARCAKRAQWAKTRWHLALALSQVPGEWIVIAVGLAVMGYHVANGCSFL